MRYARLSLLPVLLLHAACSDQLPDPEPARSAQAGPNFTFGTSALDVATAVTASTSAIYVTGYTNGALDGAMHGDADGFVRRYDDEGDMTWAAQFGTPGTDAPYGVAVNASNQVYVVGETNGSLAGSRGQQDGFVRKYSGVGAVLWTRQFGTTASDGASAASVDSAGNLYVVGYTYGPLGGSPAAGSSDAFLRKYSPAGTVLWTRQWGGAGGDEAFAVAVDAAGNVYAAGSGPGPSGPKDAFVRKYDASGTFQWHKWIRTTGDDTADGIAVHPAGGVVVVGSTYGSLAGASLGSSDVFVRRLSASGGTLFTAQFGSAGDDRGRGISVDPAGNYYPAGSPAAPFREPRWAERMHSSASSAAGTCTAGRASSAAARTTV